MAHNNSLLLSCWGICNDTFPVSKLPTSSGIFLLTSFISFWLFSPCDIIAKIPHVHHKVFYGILLVTLSVWLIFQPSTPNISHHIFSIFVTFGVTTWCFLPCKASTNNNKDKQSERGVVEFSIRFLIKFCFNHEVLQNTYL